MNIQFNSIQYNTIQYNKKHPRVSAKIVQVIQSVMVKSQKKWAVKMQEYWGWFHKAILDQFIVLGKSKICSLTSLMQVRLFHKDKD